MRILIIGAEIDGLGAAQLPLADGHEVAVFDLLASTASAVSVASR